MPLPSKIRFTSDDNEAAIVENTIDESGGDCTADYIYTKSTTKKGKTFEMSLSRINKLLDTTITIPKNAKWVSKKLGSSSPAQKPTETAGKTTTELAEMLKAMPQKKKRGSQTGAKK